MRGRFTDDRRTGEVALSDMELLKFRLGYVKQYKAFVFLALATVIAGTIINLLPELYLRVIFDEDLPQGNIGNLILHGGLMIGLYLISWLISFLNSYLVSYIGENSTYNMRHDMFRKMTHQSQAFFDKNKSGQINSRITNDVETLSNFLGSSFVDIISAILQLVGIIAIMVYLDVELGLISLSIIPLMVLLALFIRGPIRRISQKSRSSVAEVTTTMAENLSGAKVSKAFAREKVNQQEFDKINRKNFEINMKATSLFALIQPLFVTISALSTVILMSYTGWQVEKYSVGTITTFNAYLSRFFFPVIILTAFYSTYQSALASLERIYVFLKTPIKVTEAKNAVPLTVEEGTIAYESVRFAYDNGVPLFEGLSVTIKGKSTTAVVGATGAGKSTFVKLLARFYDPTSGKITIDGQDIKTVSFKSLREHVGLVPQTPFLFKGTILHNLTYGTESVPLEKIEKVVKMLGLDRLINKLPNGYMTEISEGGASLSMGQRQLIAFARLLIHDPEILILDEATSSLDSISEVKVQRALEHVISNRTAIIIAHRLSTIRNADRILVFQNGRIVEDGTHEELLENGQVYRELYLRQLEQLTMPNP